MQKFHGCLFLVYVIYLGVLHPVPLLSIKKNAACDPQSWLQYLRIGYNSQFENMTLRDFPAFVGITQAVPCWLPSDILQLPPIVTLKHELFKYMKS